MSNHERNIKLTIEYDGSGFCGWQVQSKGRTIQGFLMDIISPIVNHKISIVCAGRTDTGVHALGQVINFHTTSTIDLKNLQRAINSKTMPEIAVINAEDMDLSFNARRHAKSRWYRYRIHHHAIPRVFESRTSYHYTAKLDLPKMRHAGEILLGTHDFSCFNSSPELTKNPVRTITHFTILEEGEFLVIDIRANAFLHHMIRAIVGTLIEIGRGKIKESDMQKILHSKNRVNAGYNVPPHGLFLMQVDY